MRLRRQGRLDDAWTALLEAQELARSAADAETEAYALLGRAQILKQRFEIGAAREVTLEALGVARRAGGERGLAAQAAVTHELGNLAKQQGDFAAALEFFEQSVQLSSADGNWSRVSEALRSLGVLAFALRDPRRAENYARRALELAEAFGDPAQTAECLREVGAVLAWRGRREHAEDLYGQAEEIYRRALESIPDGDDGLRASVEHRFGVLDLDRGRTEEAIKRLRLAADLRRRAGDSDGLALTLLQLGVALIEDGRLDGAREPLAAALDHYRRRDSPDQIAICQYHLARLELGAGRLDAALAAIEQALDLIRELRAHLTTDTMRLEFFSRVRPHYDLYVHLLMRLAATRPGAGYEDLAFRASEEARARGLLDLLIEAETDLRQGIDPDLERQAVEVERNLNYLRDQLTSALARDPASERAAHLRELYEATEEQLAALERRLQALSPSYRDLRAARPLEVEAVQQVLGPGRALIEYWIGDWSSFVFAVTSDGLEVRALPSGHELRDRTTAFRKDLRRLLPRERFAADGRRLYADLIAPVEAAVGARAEWIVVPDGPLQTLPFEALLGADRPGEERYLVESRAVSYAPSATVLAALARGTPPPAGAGPRFVVFADPTVERRAAVVCPRDETAVGDGAPEPAPAALPASRLEGEKLVALHGAGESEAFFGAAATEDAVKRSAALRAASRVHFATHGLVCESRPERSALILAGGGASEDGLLELRDIFGLRLAADLVVLSACETGLGRNVDGEGMVGLSRAFLYAGAESVVVSLWQVADESTAELMVSFYRELERGGPGADKAEALRAAKRAMISGGGPRAHPYYWAPFILIGSPEAAAPR
jgi:CHAT domain-containing protein